MKKVILSACIAAAAFMMTACQAKKEAAPLSAINGEWNITSIDGAVVDASTTRENPFIVFDTATGKMFGFSGCNRMMSSFDVNSQPGKLDLQAVSSTRMACPDMTVEQQVLAALAKVKGFDKEMDDKIVLCDAEGKAVMTLEPKKNDMTVDKLNGSWMITQVNGEAIPTGMENQPFIEFNIAEKRVHGNAGCNVVNGGFETSTENPTAISFPGLITTMMSCPDLETEQKILNALNSVATFAKADNGIGLYNAQGELVIVLEKK